MAFYSFEVEHAERWGVNEAIFLHNLIHWLRLNKAERRNIQAGKDGVTRVWSYNTMEAISLLYPFWKTHQVRYVIDSLRSQGVIVTDKLSTEKFDRTLWFAVADESLLHLPEGIPEPGSKGSEGGDTRFEKFRKSKGENPQIERERSQTDLRKSANGDANNRKSLLGSDRKHTNIKQQMETLNVEGGDVDIKNIELPDTDDSTFQAVQAVVDRFDDKKSRLRFKQLRLICRDNNRIGLWQDALRSTEKRMRSGEIHRPGAYFCAALVRQLEEVGIIVPTGTVAEREEIQGLIAASLGGPPPPGIQGGGDA